MSAPLAVQLFGNFSVFRGPVELPGFESPRVRELFAFMLLHGEGRLGREQVAGSLWPDSAAGLARKALRQALWHLRTALEAALPGSASPLLAGEEWIGINMGAGLDSDVADFERRLALLGATSGAELDEAAVASLKAAVELYRGELLAGWPHEWCVIERQRLQDLALGALDRLLAICERERLYAETIAYGARLLVIDPAHERTHRRLMRTHLRAGNRTAALRQFERCAAALRDELGVAPSRRTLALLDQIRAEETAGASDSAPASTLPDRDVLASLVSGLEKLSATLGDAQIQVRRGIEALTAAVEQRR